MVALTALATSIVAVAFAAKQAFDNSRSVDVNNLLAIIRDAESLSEAMLIESDAMVLRGRYVRVANYMEILARLVNKGRFSSVVRQEVENLVVNFLATGRAAGVLDELLTAERRVNDRAFHELARVERRNRRQLEARVLSLQTIAA